MIYVGIDPGMSGSVVALHPDDKVEAWTMPHEDEAIIELLHEFEVDSLFTVFIEKIPKFAGNARFAERNIYGASLAVLYGNYRFCAGVLHGLGNPARELVPIKWQNVVQCRNRERLDKGDWKRKLKARAQELFPHVRVTLANADALLIAYAGRVMADSGQK